MAWRRNEIWFDADVLWFRERFEGQNAALAMRAPSFALPGDALSLDVPDGLSASRRRRAELRRRRFARRTRAAAFVIAPATLIPIAGQRLAGGSTGPLSEDPASLGVAPLGAPSPASHAAERAATPRTSPAPASEQAKAEDLKPVIEWTRASAHGLPYAGSLHDATQLPVEGPDWVTWNPVTDRGPNRPERLYGHQRTIRAIVAVAAAHRAAHPNAPRLVIGDISYAHGGPMSEHVSHQNGLDVDVYYPRKDRALRAPGSAADVDRRLAQDLLDRFLDAGARMVFVGYHTGLHGPSGVVVPYPNHENHLHVRFPRP